MCRIDRILYPADLAESRQQVYSYVKTMAAKFDSEVHILFVFRPPDHFKGFPVPMPYVNRFRDYLSAGAEKVLESFRQKYFGDVQMIRIKAVPGDVSREILHYIRNQRIDLVIMGTHGRKGLDKVLFGSVAEQVVKTSPVPVLVVNPNTPPDWRSQPEEVMEC